MVYKFFNNKSTGSVIKSMSDQQLVNELINQLLKNLKRVYSSFRDKIWGIDLTGMTLISKYSQWIRYLLRAIGLLRKYAWGVSLKDNKRVTIVNVF